MHPVNLIRSFIACAILYLASAAPSTTPPTTTTAMNTKQYSNGATTTGAIAANNTKNADTTWEIISDLSEHHSAGPRFLADVGTDSDLSDNEGFYIGAILLINAIVFFGVVFYLLMPWTRMCSWFSNCKHNNAGHGYYPAGLGHSMDEMAARKMGTFNAPDRHFSKRSLEYVVPILKAIAEAYDKYENSSTAKVE